MLPAHIRLLLLSATVGNAAEFLNWLERCHGRKVELVEGKERKVPLTYHWVPDQFLNEQLVADGQGRRPTRARRRPWSSASIATNAGAWPSSSRACRCCGPAQKAPLHAEVNKLDWTQGVGPKMKQMLHRGVGVHHAGMLPKYRRVVEDLFERKLLAVVHLHRDAGLRHQLPARSVVLDLAGQGAVRQAKADRPQHGPPDFRPGRPAAVRRPRLRLRPGPRGRRQDPALEGEVRPDSRRTRKDPGLLKAKKALKRKKPTRSETVQYWSEGAVQAAPGGAAGQALQQGAAALAAAGVPAQDLAGGRPGPHGDPQTADGRAAHQGQREGTSNAMLLTLAAGGFVTLDPTAAPTAEPGSRRHTRSRARLPAAAETYRTGDPGARRRRSWTSCWSSAASIRSTARSCINQLGIADRDERLQALESVLEMPRPLLRHAARALPGRSAARPAGHDPARRGADPPRPDHRQAVP